MQHGPVLIVEDDPTIRNVLLDALEQEGYPAVAVENGVDALTAVNLREPSVVLLDLNLPLLDGEGVLRELRERRLHVPVLLMTADPRGDNLTFRDGVHAHVPKPFDLDDLLMAIQMAQMPPLGTGSSREHQTA